MFSDGLGRPRERVIEPQRDREPQVENRYDLRDDEATNEEAITFPGHIEIFTLDYYVKKKCLG